MTPAQELRTAATKLRALIKDVPSEHWGDRPWQAEECSDTDGMAPCACIVSQGEYREFNQPQTPPIQYVADAETPEFAAYIAAMHPGVGLALADWLDETATEVAAAQGTEYELHPTGGVFTSWEAALAAARQVLGTAP